METEMAYASNQHLYKRVYKRGTKMNKLVKIRFIQFKYSLASSNLDLA